MRTITILLLLITQTFVFGQSEPAFWLKTGLSKKVNKKFDIDLSLENRWTEGLAFHQTYFGEFGLSFNPNKQFTLSGFYRLINRRKDEASPYNTRHRFFADLSYSKKFGVLKLKNRVRYQNQFRDTDNEIAFDKSYLRNKLEFGLDNKTIFEPYISADLFYQMGGSFEELRWKVGSDIKLTKSHRLDIGGFLSQPLGDNFEGRRFVIDLSYKFRF